MTIDKFNHKENGIARFFWLPFGNCSEVLQDNLKKYINSVKKIQDNTKTFKYVINKEKIFARYLDLQKNIGQDRTCLLKRPVLIINV